MQILLSSCPPHCMTTDTPYSYMYRIYIVLNFASGSAPLRYISVAVIACFILRQLTKSRNLQLQPLSCPPNCITSDTPYSYMYGIYIVLNFVSGSAPLTYISVAVIACFILGQSMKSLIPRLLLLSCPPNCITSDTPYSYM
jgi:hypothetical protein